MLEKQWRFKPLPLASEELHIRDELARQIGISEALATLLWQRQVGSFDQARSFFRPQLADLHDPFEMKDMDRAVERLTTALEMGEKILVYGDYDVDGTTAVTLMYGFLKGIGADVAFYIPDRYREGYGLQPAGLAYAREQGFSLLITLDCGIKSVDLIAEGSQQGLSFIVCDHHRPGPVLPPAAAVLDPKRSDCPYPFKELTGCGVGFKLLQGLCRHHGWDEAPLLEALDLVMVSIAADIVPVTGENRILCHYGLQQINRHQRPGLRALCEVAGLKQLSELSQVVFGLAPRINAAGRIKHAHDAVQLMLSENDAEAAAFAAAVNTHNLSRREFDSRMTREALDMIATDEALTAARSTVLFREDWNKGVVGIVASRCIEHYYRPTIILTLSNEKAAGSARSVAGFDVYEAIEACADLLEQFGGHMYAAGLSLLPENVPAFRQRFEEVVSRNIRPEHLTPVIDIDLELDLSEINEKFYRILLQMSPFGPENMTPVFVSRRLKLYGTPRVLKEKHLRLDVRQGSSAAFPCIGFGMAHHYEALLAGQPFDICYQLEMNEFQGRRNLQLHLKDLKPAHDSAY